MRTSRQQPFPTPAYENSRASPSKVLLSFWFDPVEGEKLTSVRHDELRNNSFPSALYSAVTFINLSGQSRFGLNWDLVRQQYDQMIKYATALRLGTAETEAILRRFTNQNVQHPTYKAFAELGKAIKRESPTADRRHTIFPPRSDQSRWRKCGIGSDGGAARAPTPLTRRRSCAITYMQNLPVGSVEYAQSPASVLGVGLLNGGVLNTDCGKH
jgi:hypothetical protein